MRLTTNRTETQDSFEILANKSPVALCIVQDGRFCSANPAFENITGYSEGELLGRDYLEFIVPEDRERVRENTTKVLNGERVLPCQFELVHKNGSIKWIVEWAVSIRYGGRWAALGSSIDITEQKRSEDTLRNSEGKLRQIFEAATDGISAIDLKGIITDANRRMREMHGFSSKNELSGKSIFELLAPREHWRMAANLEEAVEGGAASGVEYALLRADGSEFPGELSINMLKDAKGDPSGHIIVARDITKRKEIDEALKCAADEWSRTFDSINDAVCINSKDFRLLRVNKAFVDMYQVEPSQVLDKHCYEVTGEGRGPVERCPHQETLRTEKPAKSEFFVHEKGAYVEISTSPVFNRRGEITAVVHITRDITEQKLQNERLMSTDRLASLGELAAGTAHEFNNPLTSVIGLSQLLLQRDIPDDIREDLKLINSEAQRAANVARNLLAFGAKHPPAKQPDQINSIIEDVLELRAYEHKANNIDVERHLALDLPKIIADYFQMQQVFMNIIINAEYFMIDAHHGGTLTITTKRHNDVVRISIGDDGPGIPHENLSRIFDPFFTTKEAGKGTGLGLSICHGIVKEHGGQIYVSSQLGKGTTIFVDLPIDGHGCPAVKS
jgi:PAS domain S-box-containing protein